MRKFPLCANGGAALSFNFEIGEQMLHTAIFHIAEEGGFWAEVPALPGCVTQGETMEEVKANVREAVELWLSVEESVRD